MLDYNSITHKLIESYFEDTDKFFVLFDIDTKIIDCNKSFIPFKEKYVYLIDMVTYTHSKSFLNNVKSLNELNPIVKFTTNFSLNTTNIASLPETYEVVLHFQENKIYMIAEAKSPLSKEDAKLYLNLVNDFSKTSRELHKIKKHLEMMNNSLQEKIDEAVDEIRKKDEVLLKKARDAAMGEMIDSIAHQWKNQLSIISTIAQTITFNYEYLGKIEEEQVLSSMTKIDEQVKHLISTLEEFRSFFRPNRKVEDINLIDLIDSAIVLMKDQLTKKQVDIVKKGDMSLHIKTNLNHFRHVIINLIVNSIDSFEEKDIKDRTITLNLTENDHNIILTYQDNAGGIPKEIINNIFEANFTTKATGKGTGMGLYLVTLILEKIDSTITVKNVEIEEDNKITMGAQFTITMNK